MVRLPVTLLLILVLQLQLLLLSQATRGIPQLSAVNMTKIKLPEALTLRENKIETWKLLKRLEGKCVTLTDLNDKPRAC